VAEPTRTPLQEVAERIVARYLKRGLTSDVQIVSGFRVHASRGVDITTQSADGARRSVKVKADPYYGTDASKVGDRSLPYYRADTGSVAFEAVANAATKAPGWMMGSEADDLYYYYLALGQEEDEVVALLQERDEVFFSEIRVERDDLLVMPMAETKAWFFLNAEKYPPRPVMVGDSTAWYRLVPRRAVLLHVPGVRILGPVFSGLSL